MKPPNDTQCSGLLKLVHVMMLFIALTCWGALADDDNSLWESSGREYVINDQVTVHGEDVMLLFPDATSQVGQAWIYKRDGVPFAAVSFNESGYSAALVEGAYSVEQLQAISTDPAFAGTSTQTGTLILSSNSVRLNVVVIASPGYDPDAKREDDDEEDDDDEGEEEHDDYEDDEEGEEDSEEEGEDYEDEEEGEEEDDGLETVHLEFEDRVVEVQALILRDEGGNVIGADVCGMEECCWLIAAGILDQDDLDEIIEDAFIQETKDTVDAVTMTLEDGTELPAIAFVEAVDFNLAAEEEDTDLEGDLEDADEEGEDYEGEESEESDDSEEEEGEDYEEQEDYEAEDDDDPNRPVCSASWPVSVRPARELLGSA